MRYHVARNGQTYGPYTLEDLQRYIASGHILLSDSARAEDSTDWIPVPALLESLNVAVPASSTSDPIAAGAAAGIPPAYNAVPGVPPMYAASATPNAIEDPPNLSWGLLLLFGILTCGIFTVIYDLTQAFWWKRVRPSTRVPFFYIAAYASYLLNTLCSGATLGAAHHGSHAGATSLSVIGGLASLAGLVLILVARFSFRSELLEHYNTVEPVGLTLSGIMTFFFGGLYFEYHFNRINAVKQAMRFGTLPRL